MSKQSQDLFIRPIHGSVIAAARQKRGWTQHDLAARTGISREAIAYRERSSSVRGDLAAQFDEYFGGKAWRDGGEAPTIRETQSPETLKMLKQVMAQIVELKRHVLIIERNMMYRRRR